MVLLNNTYYPQVILCRPARHLTEVVTGLYLYLLRKILYFLVNCTERLPAQFSISRPENFVKETGIKINLQPYAMISLKVIIKPTVDFYGEF